ncbi:MAG: DUF3572 domain-containing protein [Pseudomonadota bacterium]
MTRDEADGIAILALQHIASDKDLLDRFLTTTGLDPKDLRSAATEPGFLASTLEYLRQHEEECLAFAANAGLSPEKLARASHVLSGDPASGTML